MTDEETEAQKVIIPAGEAGFSPKQVGSRGCPFTHLVILHPKISVPHLSQKVRAVTVPIPVSEHTMVFSVRDQRRKTESAPGTPCEITHHRAFKQKPAGPSLDPDTAARRAAAEWKPAHYR